MNFSEIEKMIMRGDMSAEALRYLINCKGECEWLDFKEALKIDDDYALSNFSKDVVGLKNVGGGYLVIGVQDKTWYPVGMPAQLPYDTKQLRDKVFKCTGLTLEIDLVHHNLYISGREYLLGLILVRASKNRHKRRTPSLIAKDFCTKESYGLRRGEIYVRKGDSTLKITSQAELIDLLENLEDIADKDSISNTSSPFAIEDGLFRLLEKGFDSFIGRNEIKKQIVDAVLKDPRIWIINVHGPGGVGKSALVNWAVYKFYEDKTFESIIHLTGKDTILTTKGIEKYSRSLYSLENLLDHILYIFEYSTEIPLEKKKELVMEIFSAWNTLIVLDNMETVSDGRILSFVQSLPIGTKAKVLITSRQKTGGWELPIPIKELNEYEVEEFLVKRVEELKIDLQVDEQISKKIWQVTGGLPLAIQWILGNYRLSGDLNSILELAKSKDAPILEFSFRNIWDRLPNDSKQVLAAMTIFDEPPTVQQISIATEFSIERIQNSLEYLTECTLVNKIIQFSDGKQTFTALPITLNFAKFQLGEMGEFEIMCRRKIQKYSDQMKLVEFETKKFHDRFEKYGIDKENEKRAAILCQKGESELFIGNLENAELLFKQARELDPVSAYPLIMSASYELGRNRIGNAISFISEATKKVNKYNAALCYSVKARIHFATRDNENLVKSYEKVLEYEPDNDIIRHQYGVLLSKMGKPIDAINQFNIIIDRHIKIAPPSLQLLIALNTRMKNCLRLNNIEQLEKDRKLVSKYFKDYPHLASEAHRFSNLL
ncbi:MAG: hypothetical protein DYG98_23350 [Haliscomenobacteraceae bacterium CHB4]|nr:hypothetical protein [Saprospiraceae bacterium]MCE7925996.1 hypothetical protein [Haliscomenobacteraceae bacterium CHB4]